MPHSTAEKKKKCWITNEYFKFKVPTRKSEVTYNSTCLCDSIQAFLPLLLCTSLVAQMVKNLPAMRKTWVRSLVWEDALEKGMATHSSILA